MLSRFDVRLPFLILKRRRHSDCHLGAVDSYTCKHTVPFDRQCFLHYFDQFKNESDVSVADAPFDDDDVFTINRETLGEASQKWSTSSEDCSSEISGLLVNALFAPRYFGRFSVLVSISFGSGSRQFFFELTDFFLRPGSIRAWRMRRV
jgi:hypothetical protein